MSQVEATQRPSPLNPGPQWLRASELRLGAPLGPMSPSLPRGSCTGSPASSLRPISCAGGSGRGSSPTLLGPGSGPAIGRGRSPVAGLPSSKLPNKAPWSLLARWPALLDVVPEQGTSRCHPPPRQGTRGVVPAGPPFCQSPYFGARAALPALKAA